MQCCVINRPGDESLSINSNSEGIYNAEITCYFVCQTQAYNGVALHHRFVVNLAIYKVIWIKCP